MSIFTDQFKYNMILSHYNRSASIEAIFLFLFLFLIFDLSIKTLPFMPRLQTHGNLPENIAKYLYKIFY